MKDNLTNEKSFGRTVLSLVLPLAIQNLINVAVNGADVFMLQMIGETSLSAASMAGQVYFILTLIFFGLSSGAAVLTAQYWGKRDTRTVEKVMGMTVRFSVTVGLVFFAVAFCFPRAVMSVLTDVPAVIDEGVQYLRIMACSYPITAVTIICLNVLRSVERVHISTIVYLLSLFTNIGMNLCFIKGWLGFPQIGITGVAIATVSARLLEIVITLVYVWRNGLIRLRFKDIFKRNKTLSKDFLRYSMPVVLNEMLWGTAISLSATVIGHLGQEPIAAQSVATTVRQLAMIVVFGIANATAIIVGKEIGAGRIERAKIYSRKLMRFGLVAGICGAGLMIGLHSVIPSVMGNLSELAAEYLRFMLLAMSVYVIFSSVSATGIVGVFRAGGDTRMGLLLDVGTLWVICLPLGFLAAFVWRLDVKWVFLILISDELLKFPIVLWRFRSMKWLNNVTRDEVTKQNEAEVSDERERTA